MTLFVLTYDERISTHDYTPLYDLLNSWGAAHLQNSVWLANLNGKAAAVRDAMRIHMHPNDTIAVIELAAVPDWATIGTRPEGLTWLKARNP